LRRQLQFGGIPPYRPGPAAHDWYPGGDEVLAARFRAPDLRYACVLVALAALWLAMLLWGGGPLDARIYEALYAGHRPALLTFARVMTFFGEPTLLVGAGFVVAAWLWWRGNKRLPMALLLIILVGRGISEIQKFTPDGSASVRRHGAGVPEPPRVHRRQRRPPAPGQSSPRAVAGTFKPRPCDLHHAHAA